MLYLPPSYDLAWCVRVDKDNFVIGLWPRRCRHLAPPGDGQALAEGTWNKNYDLWAFVLKCACFIYSWSCCGLEKLLPR